LEVDMNLPDNCKFVSDVPLESCHNEGQTLTSAQLSGNVLLAEDHEDNRQLIVMMLTKLGLTVVEARNGEEAVQLAMAQDFDLILLDIQMPVMDGLQAREMLSQIGVDAPIIALTANAMKHEVENYMTVGFDDYLAKPIKRAHFIETIAAYLNQADEVTKDKPEGTFINDEFDILKNNYIDTLRYEVEQLLVYAEDRNYAQISCISHAIKGTAGNFGLSPATELAGHIESLAREAKLDHDLLKKLFTYALEQVDLAKNTVD
jgi:CheY-like chemotaxis protein